MLNQLDGRLKPITSWSLAFNCCNLICYDLPYNSCLQRKMFQKELFFISYLFSFFFKIRQKLLYMCIVLQ